ncbi:MAG: TetR/AcrR family transcriptional regulator, partial [Alphaproteobacteria bacterium]
MPIESESSAPKKDKKALLLATARRIVADGGFQDLRMATVAIAAGMAVGTIYRYFPSKMQLCVELVSMASQREVDVLAGIALSEGP